MFDIAIVFVWGVFWEKIGKNLIINGCLATTPPPPHPER